MPNAVGDSQDPGMGISLGPDFGNSEFCPAHVDLRTPCIPCVAQASFLSSFYHVIIAPSQPTSPHANLLLVE